jgi:trehalose-6-phosphatase
MIRQFSSKKPIDFLMYIGDDLQSEQVFQHLNQLKKQPKSEALLTKEATILTCTIGRRVTQANYFLSSPDAVLNLLQKLPDPMALTPTKNFESNLSMA